MKRRSWARALYVAMVATLLPSQAVAQNAEIARRPQMLAAASANLRAAIVTSNYRLVAATMNQAIPAVFDVYLGAVRAELASGDITRNDVASLIDALVADSVHRGFIRNLPVSRANRRNELRSLILEVPAVQPVAEPVETEAETSRRRTIGFMAAREEVMIAFRPGDHRLVASVLSQGTEWARRSYCFWMYSERALGLRTVAEVDALLDAVVAEAVRRGRIDDTPAARNAFRAPLASIAFP